MPVPRTSRLFLPLAAFCLGGGTHLAHAADFQCTVSDAVRASLDASAADAAPRDASPAQDENSSPIDISSDEANLGVGGEAELKGNVRVRQGEREIDADDVRYNPANQSFEVEGTIRYRDPLVNVKGGGGRYSATEGANFHGAEFELLDRGARGAAREMSLSPEGVIRLDSVSFTTCPASDVSWQLRADEITLDTRTRLGTGRGARVEFKGVPIVYLPWMSFPLGTQRKSGFLFPSIGHSTRSGLQLAVPYYWNIAPNADLTFEPTNYARRGLDISGNFRYLSESQRSSLSFNFLPNDRLFDDDRSRFRPEHFAQLPRNFRLIVDAENVSDTNYFEDFAQGAEGTSVAFVERLVRLSYRDEHWRLTGDLQQFQTIDRELTLLDRPYARVPRLTAAADFALGGGGWFNYGFDSELVNFERSTGVTGWRLDVRPSIGLEVNSPGFFLRPSVAMRYTGYELDETAPGQRRDPDRSLPTASFDTGLIFERPAGSRASRTLTLEPRLLYLYAPYRNQDDLPIFDTGVPDLNLVQLFRTNRFVGADRVGDANQVSLGVTSRLLDAGDGTQFIAATLGQTFYFENPRVRLPDEVLNGTPNNRERSDLVAQLSLSAFQHWNAELGLQWNPDRTQSERGQVQLQYKPDADRVFNIGYRLQRERLEQAETSAAWPLGEHWRAFGRLVYSLRDDDSIERFAGVEYGACCWRARLVGRRFVSSRTGEQDTGIYLQLELTGLASVGSAADSFLEDEIRGYSPLSATR